MTTQTISVLFLSKLSRPTKENQLSHPTSELPSPSVAMMMMEMKAYYSSHCVLHSKMVAMSVWASARKRHQPNSQLRSLLVSDWRERCPCHPGQARGAPRGRGGRSPQPQHGHNGNMEGNTPQLPPAGLGPAPAAPAPLRPRPRPTRNFRGRRSGRPGRGARGGRVSPARTPRPLRLLSCRATPALGSDFAGEAGPAAAPPSSAPPGPGALKLQSGGGGGAVCAGVTEAPRGQWSGRRAERGKGRVAGGAGRAGPPHKGRSPAAPCGHSPAAAAPCRCRSARRWAGSCG